MQQSSKLYILIDCFLFSSEDEMQKGEWMSRSERNSNLLMVINFARDFHRQARKIKREEL